MCNNLSNEYLHDGEFLRYGVQPRLLTVSSVPMKLRYKLLPLVLFMSTTLALYPISRKQIIGMESTTFATSWYYSRLQLIDSEWRVEVK